MLIQRYKAPLEVLDFPLDWSDWLAESITTDTITDSAWTGWLYSGSSDADTSPFGIDHDQKTTTMTAVWLTGGNPGEVWAVQNTITTAQGRHKEFTFLVGIKPDSWLPAA